MSKSRNDILALRKQGLDHEIKTREAQEDRAKVTQKLAVKQAKLALGELPGQLERRKAAEELDLIHKKSAGAQVRHAMVLDSISRFDTRRQAIATEADEQAAELSRKANEKRAIVYENTRKEMSGKAWAGLSKHVGIDPVTKDVGEITTLLTEGARDNPSKLAGAMEGFFSDNNTEYAGFRRAVLREVQNGAGTLSSDFTAEEGGWWDKLPRHQKLRFGWRLFHEMKSLAETELLEPTGDFGNEATEIATVSAKIAKKHAKEASELVRTLRTRPTGEGDVGEGILTLAGMDAKLQSTGTLLGEIRLKRSKVERALGSKFVSMAPFLKALMLAEPGSDSWNVSHKAVSEALGKNFGMLDDYETAIRKGLGLE